MLLLLTADFFLNNLSFSNCLDPDQDQHSLGPDLGPNTLQRLSADDKKSPLARKELRSNSFEYPMFLAKCQSECSKSVQRTN